MSDKIEYIYARSDDAKTRHILDMPGVSMCSMVGYGETEFRQQQNWRNPDRAQARIDRALALPTCKTCLRAWEAEQGA